MKTIKHLALLLLTVTLIYSCSKDAGLDPIVGTWTLSTITALVGEEEPVTLTACRMQSTFEFRADRTFTLIDANDGRNNDENCFVTDPIGATWQDNEDGTYTLGDQTSMPNNTLTFRIPSQTVTLEEDILTVIFRRFELIGIPNDPRPQLFFFEERQDYTKVP